MWLHLSGFLMLTWVWPCCLVTPQSLVQTLALFNLVRVLPPFLPSIPRLKFHARPPGSWSVRHCCGHKDLQRMLLVNTLEPIPPALSPVSPQQYVKNVLLLWHTSELSQPPRWSISQWWRYYTVAEYQDATVCHSWQGCLVHKAYQQVIKGFHNRPYGLYWLFLRYFPF